MCEAQHKAKMTQTRKTKKAIQKMKNLTIDHVANYIEQANTSSRQKYIYNI